LKAARARHPVSLIIQVAVTGAIIWAAIPVHVMKAGEARATAGFLSLIVVGLWQWYSIYRSVAKVKRQAVVSFDNAFPRGSAARMMVRELFDGIPGCPKAKETLSEHFYADDVGGKT